jgi:hypothetical protein
MGFRLSNLLDWLMLNACLSIYHYGGLYSHHSKVIIAIDNWPWRAGTRALRQPAKLAWDTQGRESKGKSYTGCCTFQSPMLAFNPMFWVADWSCVPSREEETRIYIPSGHPISISNAQIIGPIPRSRLRRPPRELSKSLSWSIYKHKRLPSILFTTKRYTRYLETPTRSMSCGACCGSTKTHIDRFHETLVQLFYNQKKTGRKHLRCWLVRILHSCSSKTIMITMIIVMIDQLLLLEL